MHNFHSCHDMIYYCKTIDHSENQTFKKITTGDFVNQDTKMSFISDCLHSNSLIQHKGERKQL